MGIEDLRDLLKEKVPQTYTTAPLRSFSGYVVAIDAAWWTYTYKSGALNEALGKTSDAVGGIDQAIINGSLVDSLVRFIGRLVAYNITPIWILDGETRPEKKAAQERRKDKKSKVKEQIEAEKARLLQLHPLERVSADAEFRRLLKNNIYVTSEEAGIVNSTVAAMGIPVITAPHDAEAFACMLALEKKVAAVWTIDSDVFLFGIAINIRSTIGYTGAEPTVEVGLPQLAIQGLGMSLAQFVDMGIILQCDFNVRMKGNGMAFAHKAITQYGSIEATMAAFPNKPWPDLCHVRCREIFSPHPTGIPFDALRVAKERLVEFNETRHDRDLTMGLRNLTDPIPSPW